MLCVWGASALPPWACVTYLLVVGLVAADGLGAIKVRVDTGVDLVHHVRLVGTGGVGGRAGTTGVAEGATTVAVRVDAGVHGVGDTAVVGAVGAGGSTVGAGHAGSASAAGVMARGVEAGAGAGAAEGVVGASATEARVAGGASVAHGLGAITVRVDARVGNIGHAGRVRTIGALVSAAVAGRAKTGRAHGAARVANGGRVTSGASVTHGLGAIAVRVDTRVGNVGKLRGVRAVVALGCTGVGAGVGAGMGASVASGTEGVTSAGVGVASARAELAVTSAAVARAVHIGVYSGVGSVGNAGVVGASSALGCRVRRGVVVLVGRDSLLDLVDDAGHVDGCVCGIGYVLFVVSTCGGSSSRS